MGSYVLHQPSLLPQTQSHLLQIFAYAAVDHKEPDYEARGRAKGSE